jgi:hypothetical protein
MIFSNFLSNLSALDMLIVKICSLYIQSKNLNYNSYFYYPLIVLMPNFLHTSAMHHTAVTSLLIHSIFPISYTNTPPSRNLIYDILCNYLTSLITYCLSNLICILWGLIYVLFHLFIHHQNHLIFFLSNP